MFIVLIIISTFTLANALTPINNVELADEEIKSVINKYISKIDDIEEQYIVDERISRAISHYFKGKISSFPLYKISVKIDRTPVKIPWTLGDPKLSEGQSKHVRHEKARDRKRYKYKKMQKNKKKTAIELPKTPDNKIKNVETTTDPARSSLPTLNTT